MGEKTGRPLSPQSAVWPLSLSAGSLLGVLQNGSIFQYRMHKHSKENYPAIGVLSLQTPESADRAGESGEMDGTELPAVQNSWFSDLTLRPGLTDPS